MGIQINNKYFLDTLMMHAEVLDGKRDVGKNTKPSSVFTRTVMVATSKIDSPSSIDLFTGNERLKKKKILFLGNRASYREFSS